MKKLITIINKDLSLIFHSKISLILLFLGPILLMSIVGLGLSDNGLKNIPAGIYTEEKSVFYDNFKNSLNLNSFQVQDSRNLGSCIADVRSGKNSLCIHLERTALDIPEELGISPEEIDKSGVGYKIKLHADFSKPRIVWGIIARVNSVTEIFARGIREHSEVKFKERLNESIEMLETQSRNIDDYYMILTEANRKLSQVDLKIPLISSAHDIGSALSAAKVGMQDLERNLPSEFHYLIGGPKLKVEKAYLEWYDNNYSNLYMLHSDIAEVQSKIYDVMTDLKTLQRELDESIDDTKEIGKLNWDYILHPIPLSYTALSGEQIEQSGEALAFLDYLFPSFISFFILLVSVFLSSNIAIKEKISSARIRNELSKTNRITFILGNFITCFLIISLQLLILFAISSLFLSVLLTAQLANLIIVSMISISIFILIGLVLALIFDSQETTTIAAISVSLLMIIFSSLITPLETLSALAKGIISNMPFVIIENLFRKILIFESGIYSSTSSILLLFLTGLILFGLSIAISYYKRYLESSK